MADFTNVDFIKKLMELGNLFDLGVTVSYDANNILSIEGTDYRGEQENVTVEYSYGVDVEYDDNDNMVDVLTPLIKQIKRDKNPEGTKPSKVGQKIETIKEIIYGSNEKLPAGAVGEILRPGTCGWIVKFDVSPEMWVVPEEMRLIED